MGSDGLVLHLGSHRGQGFESALPAVADALIEALDSVITTSKPCPILLENTAGAGDTIRRSFDELRDVIDAAGGDERLGICLDTQHLWASGVAFATTRDADDLIATINRTVGLDRLRCLHLNDSKVAFGANRDRHENIGDGTIGAKGLGALWVIQTSKAYPQSLRFRAWDRAPGPRTWPRRGSCGQGDSSTFPRSGESVCARAGFRSNDEEPSVRPDNFGQIRKLRTNQGSLTGQATTSCKGRRPAISLV